MGEREFLLSKFWRPTSIKDYKIHFARWNRKEQPLHAFVREWSLGPIGSGLIPVETNSIVRTSFH